jgi:hypothetical protein
VKVDRRLVVAFALGVAVGALWMKAHYSCPACQRRWAAWKRSLGLRMIE